MCIDKISSTVNLFEKAFHGIFWLKRNGIPKDSSHYFKNYHKHLTIYKDGTGIIINSFDIVFNKDVKEELKRAINISDGKNDAAFPPLKTMCNVDIGDRFDKYGFWVYSEDRIISSCKEKYWANTDDTIEDKKLQNDEKELRWVFHFNYSRIKTNKPYHVVYVLSIPGMFPISDGKLDYDSINDINLKDDESYGSSSSMEIRNKIDHFKYTVSFANGVELDMSPECDLLDVNNKKIKQKLDLEYNIIYHKYTCNIKHPKLGAKIKINWRFKGGSNNEN